MNTAIITTALIGLVASVLMGLLKKGSDAIDGLSDLAKQGVVLLIAVALVVGLNYSDIAALPQPYQTPVMEFLQAVVASLSGIGMHSVRDGTVKAAKGEG